MTKETKPMVLPMTNKISARIMAIIELPDCIDMIFQNDFNLEGIRSQKIINQHLVPYLATLRDDLIVLVEFPYVDKMYRDAYYNYYSSKLGFYFRDTIRVSFFSREVDYLDFRADEQKEVDIDGLNSAYLGFLVLRPTFPRIIGRTALSPKAKKNSNMLCCLTEFHSTVYGIKLDVQAFPHASQDSQTITCAETTIWSLLEYFGNKFPDYRPVVPSLITKLLHKFSYKRLIPSDGLTAEQVTYAVRELGFGAMIYSKTKQKEDFDSIISVYIESGIPVVGVLKNENGSIGHAFNIVGRQIDDHGAILADEARTELPSGIKIIDFNKFKRKYVFIDDNYPPFQIAGLERPCEDYYTEEKWHSCEIKSIIVPLHPRIYLDATRAKKNFLQVLGSRTLGIQVSEDSVIKTFLCASRSYKEYIATNKNLDIRTKEIIFSVLMPKFIWVAEISRPDSFGSGLCDGFLIQDATEPIEYSDKTMLSNHSIIAGFNEGTVFRQDFGRFAEFNTFAHPFGAYKGNLK